MASRPSLADLSSFTWNESELARRIALAREERADEEYGKPHASRLVNELDILMEPARRLVRRPLTIAKSATPRTVMVLPGLAAHPRKMRFIARQLERAGHTAKRWGLGRNWGPTPENFALLEQRLLDLHERSGEKVVLLGWSLGGVFARELAKRHPDAVAKVISMGSPISGSPRANNAWRLYQFVTGHQVDSPPIEADVSAKPPVETVAIWSPNDSVIAPRCAAGLPGERDRAIAVRCTHLGFTYSPDVVHAVLAELERR